MKLEKLRTLQREVELQLKPEGVECSVRYLCGGKWLDLATQTAVDESTSIHLEKSRQEHIAHHATNSPVAHFYIAADECTVSLTFAKSPQIGTRKKYRAQIDKLSETATNIYKVSHNTLTHLLAKDAFNNSLLRELESFDTPVSKSADAQESQDPRLLAVMALDIDFFKQVNDAWGHVYGDQVLKTFGLRLEEAADEIREAGIGNPTVHLGHPSGEEFLICITANAPREQFRTWADDIRVKIAGEVLPTEKEWQWLAEKEDLSAISTPTISERKITTSIGVVLPSGSAMAGSGTKPHIALLDRADTALYRAKAAGRNEVIFFDEILSSCGRTIEQEHNTRIIAIDIGSNVGVSIGQEFRVFPPTFTGKRKFTINDGRSTRTLGNYPRVESTRIMVFQTQPEIAFAHISSQDDANIVVEPGSHLEAIPAGSIGHLLPNASKYFPVAVDSGPSGSIASLQEFVQETAEKSALAFSVVVRFNRESEFLRKYGVASLNIALAKLYRAAQVKFHAARMIGLLDHASICISGLKSSYKEQIVTAFAESMASELPELGVLVGVFCDADRDAKLKPGESQLEAAHSIEFARFAASEAGRSPDSRVRHFSYSTAREVLQALRESRSYDVAYADFDRLQSLGVTSPTLNNIGGLLAGSLGKQKEAMKLFEAASKGDPKSIVFKSNFGTAAYRLGEINSPLEHLNTLTVGDIDKLLELHPYGYVNYARLLAKARLAGLSSFDETRFNHMAVTALGLSDFSDSSENQYIVQALELKPDA